MGPVEVLWDGDIMGWDPIPSQGYPVMRYPHLKMGCPHLGLGYPQQKGSWDQSLAYLLERTWDQWKHFGLEMRYPPERTWDQWKYCGMEILWDGDGVTPP